MSDKIRATIIGHDAALDNFTAEEEQAWDDARVGDQQEIDDYNQAMAERQYADARREEFRTTLIVNDLDSGQDIQGHQIGQAIDAIRYLRAEVEALAGKQIDLGALEQSIVAIDQARVNHPKPVK